MDSTRDASKNARTPARWNSTRIPQRVAERAYFKVDKRPDGCWISRYSKASHGYAQVGWSDKGSKRQVVLAHRAAWTYVNGPVPVGMTLDHLCRVRECVNPDHLRLISNFENARRTHGKDWDSGSCANGHPNSFLIDAPNRKTKWGKKRIGKRCSECLVLYRARGSWRRSHPGEQMPEHLLLASERDEPGAA